eukprot:gnl/TRDRNA2_/TRDRNA2_157986_c0_seq1.p2 gnl/TRDRNA2_/TRDRNA2_157986_c0~~gnl/TRDRNA2_/TRDRNA2_157986_c0_seq1.p2  ORF type:complete len:110 (+),score=18.61 gnl/TRDRNA2_/TRDRNA2_157986_c0_seq1:3-332(+)
MKNGRPVYVRDADLSQWNHAMRYHGSGNRYLVYEDHAVHGGRWALIDSQDWQGYDDRAYAFITGDDPHPGYLEGQFWCVYRDSCFQRQLEREWLKHSSLRLVVEEETQS